MVVPCMMKVMVSEGFDVGERDNNSGGSSNGLVAIAPWHLKISKKSNYRENSGSAIMIR